VYKRIVEISLRGPHIQKQLSGKNVCKTMFISTISFRIMKAFANMSSQCQKRRFCVWTEENSKFSGEHWSLNKSLFAVF